MKDLEKEDDRKRLTEMFKRRLFVVNLRQEGKELEIEAE